MRRTSTLLVTALLFACGGSTTSETGSTAPGTAGAGGGTAGGSSAGTGGATSAGNAGSATAGTSQGGSASTGGTTGTAGNAGNTGTAGKAGGTGTAGKGGSTGTAGKGGSTGTAGSGGATSGCCTVDFDCGDFAFVPCVNGVCKPTVPNQCWSDKECVGGAKCDGAVVCPCGAVCDGPDMPGTCIVSLPPDFTICNGPGTCALTDKTCCGVCGPPKATDKAAILKSKVNEFSALSCANPGPIGCPDCIMGKNPDLAAFCISDSGEVDTCGVVEISKHKVSDCASDADCTLHLAACCDCGGATAEDFVALAISGIDAYEAQMCGGGACAADCAGNHPANLAATCDPATKHCKVTKQ